MPNFSYVNKGLRTGVNGSSIESIDYGFEAALVVDVLTNDDDLEKYNKLTGDGYEIGCVKFKGINSDINVPDDQLLWAFPSDGNITEYPMLNEIVIIYTLLGRMYYTKKLNISNRPTASPVYGFNNESKLGKTDSAINIKQINPIRSGIQKTNNVLGKTFKEDFSIYKLRHREGDIVVEGRSGNSIRIGTDVKTNKNPNIFLRVGQTPKPKIKIKGIFALIDEDINNDMTSLYMTSNEMIDLTPSTKGNDWHYMSLVESPKEFNGSQIIGNTDRIVFNTKKNEILLFSNVGIHNTANTDFTIDTGRDYYSYISRDSVSNIGKDSIQSIAEDSSIEVGRHAIYKVGSDWDMEIGEDWTISTNSTVDSTAGIRHSFISPKVYIGTRESEAEPLVCGTLLAKFLNAFIDAHLKNTPTHGIGPSGPVVLHPKVVAALMKLKVDVSMGKFASFNSTVAYTTKAFSGGAALGGLPNGPSLPSAPSLPPLLSSVSTQATAIVVSSPASSTPDIPQQLSTPTPDIPPTPSTTPVPTPTPTPSPSRTISDAYIVDGVSGLPYKNAPLTCGGGSVMSPTEWVTANNIDVTQFSKLQLVAKYSDYVNPVYKCCTDWLAGNIDPSVDSSKYKTVDDIPARTMRDKIDSYKNSAFR